MILYDVSLIKKEWKNPAGKNLGQGKIFVEEKKFSLTKIFNQKFFLDQNFVEVSHGKTTYEETSDKFFFGRNFQNNSEKTIR